MQPYRSQWTLVIIIIIAASAMNSAQTPKFNAPRAFSYLVKQCEFGPRNPGSPGHKACLEYLVAALRLEADEVQLQQFSKRFY